MSGPKVVTLPTIYRFEVGQKVRGRNMISGAISFGKVVHCFPLVNGFIVETNFDKKHLYFEGKELELNE